MLKLKNITKKFKRTVACQDIEFSVGKGEFFVLVGPSGCGKTTILRLISGLEKPDRGQVIIDWKDKTELPPQQRNTAMVFQNYALYPNMTVKENLEFPLKMNNVWEKERKRIVEQTVDLLKIDDILFEKSVNLSGGQQQRVAVGRALVRKPDVFLLDEPLSNLDAKLRQHLRVELARLQKELNITTVYVTHNQKEAMTLADRIAVMNDGEIQQIGDPDAIYSNPKNLFVAKFMGYPELNIFPASIEEGYLSVLGGEIDMPVIPNFTQKKVLIGLRPEDIIITDKDSSWEFEMDVKETLGPEMILYLKHKNNSLKIRVAKEHFTKLPYSKGTVKVYLDIEKMLFFDPKTEERLEY